MFDFLKKKNNDDKSLRDYLSLYPGWFLYDEAMFGLCCHIDGDEDARFSPITIRFHSKVKWIIESHHYKRFCKDIAAIPKKYFDEEISPIELLEIATENGHYEAPFVLFLIYEYGLDKITDFKQHSLAEMENNRNREKAAVYRELAKSRNSPFEKAFSWIENNKKVQEELPLEQYEINVAYMIPSRQETDEILGVFKDKFSKLGNFILCGLAQYGSAYSSAYLAVMLGNILRHKEDRQNSFPSMEAFFEYSDKDLNDACLATTNRLLKNAADGDDKAAFALEHWQIDLAK